MFNEMSDDESGVVIPRTAYANSRSKIEKKSSFMSYYSNLIVDYIDIHTI